MTLTKKIILSFLLSSSLIAVIGVATFVNFFEIKGQIRRLELSDTVRSKSLQLRRHEKNFFLYMEPGELSEVNRYLKELREVLREGRGFDGGKLPGLENKIEDYGQRFNEIEILTWRIMGEMNDLRPSAGGSAFYPLVKSTFLERPLLNAELLKKGFSLSDRHPVISDLRRLDLEIAALRKSGEEIIAISKEIDGTARQAAEEAIMAWQGMALMLFPLFFLVGFAGLFIISRSVVSRLRLLRRALQKTGKGEFAASKRMGKGDFPLLLAPVFKDEVSVLIQAFGEMEHNLAQRDAELARKNEEVLQSRKLASLGTLAAGVAHELNNPVNNIYLAAQILSKELTPGSPGIFRETVEDIFSQTVRVKRIIGELLEFTREKLPDLGRINLTGVVDRVLCRMITSGAMKDVKINIRAPEVVEALADEHLIEQVFINLIGNAVEAMEGNGVLDIEIKAMDTYVAIKVSDTGKGILPEDMTRVFDPFFTTKEKGTGLGLAIVYSIIEKHKGKIEVKSEPGKGATFTVTLPEEQ